MKTKLRFVLLSVLLLSIFGSVDALAQVIKGRVTDTNGQSIPGVAVFFKGTTTGASTDLNGYYAINNSGDAKVLVFSYIGMKEQEQYIGKRVKIDVVLEEDVNYLDETVVIGYQTVQRRDLMGSVTSVDSKAVTSTPSVNFASSLSGKMAGVNVTTTEGDPDAPVQIRVRGTSSITQDSSPLYIVDGFPVSSIADLNPNDIKSIDVLKDAFSTAIYGSRGAYGVVLITTKDTATGKVSVNYDGYYGVKTMANKDAVQVMEPYDFAKYLYECAMLYNKEDPSKSLPGLYTKYLGSFEDMELYKGMTGNNWVGRLFDNLGTTQNHNIQLSGRTDKGHWSVTYSRMDENAILTGSDYSRNNLSLKGFTTPVKNLTFLVNARYSNTLINGAGANAINDKGTTVGIGRLMNALKYTPIPMNYADDDADGADYSEQFGANPLKDIEDNDERRSRVNWNIYASGIWTIIPNLKLKVDVGMDESTDKTDRFYGLTSYYTRIKASILGKPNTQYTEGFSQTIRNSNTLSYNFQKVINNPKHNLDMLVGEEYSYTKSNVETVVAEGFPAFYTADMARRYRGTAEAITSSSNYFNENNVMLSFFGRVNYVYNYKYSISAALRADASSKFAKQNRWGVFPSVAASWNINKEPIFKRMKNLDQLKLRYSFGTAGNNKIPSGNIRTIFKSEQSFKLDNMTNVIFPSDVMPNEDLKWETTYSHNLGLDFAFFKERLSGAIEGYHNTTKDLLINYPIAGTGYNTQYKNLGSVLNMGLELSLRAVIVEKKNFGLSVSGNVALNKNRVLSIGDLENIQSESGCVYGVGWDYMITAGSSLGDIYGYQSAGWHGVEDFDYEIKGDVIKWTPKEGVAIATTNISTQYVRPGCPKFVDQNNDGVIDSNDKVKIGNAMPVATGGFSINSNFYGFDFNASFSFSCGNDVYNANYLQLTQRGQYNFKNLSPISTPGSAWTNVDWSTGKMFTDPEALAEANKDAKIWCAAMQGNFMSDYYVEDGSFLRLSSLTLGYTIPLRLTSKIKMQRFRVYFTGANLFCLTKYSGYDPEVNTRRTTPLTPGVDYSAYPKSRSFILGANISF